MSTFKIKHRYFLTVIPANAGNQAAVSSNFDSSVQSLHLVGLLDSCGRRNDVNG
ncbi:MAG: hypothetical protein K2W99_01325 [Chthoniobacterales bacterium]|nr:hypothetical protein [Chthoniobacterales bacterium]